VLLCGHCDGDVHDTCVGESTAAGERSGTVIAAPVAGEVAGPPPPSAALASHSHT
jgi:hypothetical protein